MSWWVYLEDEHGRVVEAPRHEYGGTFVLGGIAEAELNVTYNYGGRFREAWPLKIEGSNALGQMLDGKSGREVLPSLEHAVGVLGTEPDADYWNPTHGNAGVALAILAMWARANPDATFRVS